MSTLKNKVDIKEARRSTASILAEVLILKQCGWKIGFISAGTRSWPFPELMNLIKSIYQIYQEKFWLNIGVLSETEIKQLKPYIEGVCGTIECVNLPLRKELCPTKPLEPILKSFELYKKHDMKSAITIIIGLGETIDDFKQLEAYIKGYSIDKVIFYALNPIEETLFKKGPEIDYYLAWIKKTRDTFPKLDIVAGHWVNRVDYIGKMLDAGVNTITKFPALKLFNSKYAKEIEQQCNKDHTEFQGTLTKLPNIDVEKELKKLNVDEKTKEDIKKKLQQYLKQMSKH
jgi:biotin synthase-like enzyme